MVRALASLDRYFALTRPTRHQDVLSGVPIEINATLIMETLFGFHLGNYYR